MIPGVTLAIRSDRGTGRLQPPDGDQSGDTRPSAVAETGPERVIGP